MERSNLIFIHKILKAIADSIIIVFIPLYILKSTNDMFLAMGYLIIYSLFVLLYMFVLKRFLARFGVIAIMIHFIPIIASEAILSFCPINIYTIILCAGLMGLNQALYSIPLNLVFTFGDKKTNVGKFQIATNIGKLVFILISGYILSSEITNSFLILSISSSVFYILCMIPLLFMYKVLKANYVTFKDNNCYKRVKLDWWFVLFHISFGLFQPIMDNVLPLFLYENNLSFKAVTLMIALVELFKIIANYITQALVNKNKELICVSVSFVLFLTSILVMIFVRVPVVLYIFSCTCSISFPLTFVPMFRLYCKHLRKTNNVFKGMTDRDIDIFIFRPGLYLLSYIGFGLLPCLILGAFIVPVMLFSEIKIIKSSDYDA